MSRKASLGLVLAGVAAGSLGVLAVSPPASVVRAAYAAVEDLTRQISLFGEVFQKVRTDYVAQPDEKSMVADALSGMVSGLDAQSAYFAPADAAHASEKPGDTTATVGLLLTIDDSAAKVVSVADGSPAAGAGILAGDAIVAINGEDLSGAHLLDITHALTCGDGKPVSLTLLREGVSDPFSAKLQCAVLPSVTVTARAEGPVAYLRIARFTDRTPDELKSALKAIRAEIGSDTVKGYVLDLRSNPGGSVEAAAAVAGDFLNNGDPILSVRGRDAADNHQFAAKASETIAGQPLVVLINGGSAAEAEVVAGALKDDHRATVLGARSFGTGLVQSIIPLGREGTLRLTTARYYTPSGQAIQAKGIEPDIAVTQISAPLPAGLQPKPAATASAKKPASPAYIPGDALKDKQLQYALGLVQGTIVNPIFQPNPKKPAAG